MKKRKSFFVLLVILLFSSCYFGMFLLEQDLPGNYDLWAENELHQLKITHSSKETSGYDLIIDETVYSVGFNKNFIIAKSYSKKNKEIRYHIIEVKKDLQSRNYGMSFEDYKLKRKELNLPYNLNFTLVYNEVTKK